MRVAALLLGLLSSAAAAQDTLTVGMRALRTSLPRPSRRVRRSSRASSSSRYTDRDRRRVLPDGRYHFSASLRLNFARTPEFPAGSVDLRVAREPLPASRLADAVTYRAETSVADEPGSAAIRTTVTATLGDAGRAIGRTSAALHRFSRDCPVVLHAYRDRARRDAAPRSGPPDWTSARDCGSELQEMVLQGGEPRTFDVRVSGREILGDRLPPGRYYLAAVVRHAGRTIYLAAGDVTLGR